MHLLKHRSLVSLHHALEVLELGLLLDYSMTRCHARGGTAESPAIHMLTLGGAADSTATRMLTLDLLDSLGVS